jgi:hypothetical protein
MLVSPIRKDTRFWTPSDIDRIPVWRTRQDWRWMTFSGWRQEPAFVFAISSRWPDSLASDPGRADSIFISELEAPPQPVPIPADFFGGVEQARCVNFFRVGVAVLPNDGHRRTSHPNRAPDFRLVFA